MIQRHRVGIAVAIATATLAATAGSASAAAVGDLCQVTYGNGGVKENSWVRILGFPWATAYKVRQSDNIYYIDRVSVNQYTCSQ